MPQPLWLRIEGARQNNLKNVSLALPHDRVTVITGVSGSGKSSLAFDTLFAEGQWRYVESLSTYARMFLDRVDRPDVDRIEQIRPSVAIEQKNPVRTARSTVGTATEVYDYLRLLFAKIGRVHCPQCGTAGGSDSAETTVDRLLREHPGERALLCFPLAVPPAARAAGRGNPTAEFFASLLQRGYARVKVGGQLLDLNPPPAVDLSEARELVVVLDRVILSEEQRGRLTDSMEMAFREGGGRVEVEVLGRAPRAFAQEFRCPRCDLALARP
ncbi:MAG: excinuclease ABC subunit UvrA, partial [Candidatus Rokuibacteriota bacterium]